jgi:DNA replication protein DnaC
MWPAGRARKRFYTAMNLINDILEAQAQLRLSKLETTLSKCDLIILDELGFIPFSKEGAESALRIQCC